MAAVMQSVRTAGQRGLTDRISPLAATLVRYLFGVPFAIAYLVLLISIGNRPLPDLNNTFVICALLAGVLQIVATVFLIHLLTMRNFAVGTTYSKTEVILTAMIGALFFGEMISMSGWAAILVCVLGVVVINLARSPAISNLWGPAAMLGLGAGLGFALTALLIRKASLSFGIDDYLLTASITLCFMVITQTVMAGAYVILVSREQIPLIFTNWRPSLFVGVTSVLGSMGWFTAMTIERASYVRTVGQLEFIVALSISVLYFKEKPSRLELIGMILIVASIIVLLLTS